MKDRFVDIAEISRYGNHFISAAAQYTDIHATMMKELIDTESQLQARIAPLLEDTGNTRSSSRTSSQEQRKKVEEAVALLKKLYEKLWPERDSGTFDFRRFFSTGLKSEIKPTVADSLRGVKNVNAAFKQYPCIEGMADLQQKFAALEPTMSGQIDGASGAVTVKLSTTTEWQSLRSEWARNYQATQDIVRGLFAKKDRKAEWKKLFLDFQAAGSKEDTQEETSPVSTPASTPASSPPP